MREHSPIDRHVLDDIARRHGFSVEATRHMLDAVIAGRGGMAQFDHAEFAGPGQWMRGGMIMVSDMFNQELKQRADSLCQELSDLISREVSHAEEGSSTFQARDDHSHHVNSSLAQSGASYRSSTDWWPPALGFPDSAGSQDGLRYAYFGEARRLAVVRDGTLTVYDTLDHRIGRFAQQQSTRGTLSFWSQHGMIDVTTLPVVRQSTA